LKSNPNAFLALVPYGGGKQLLEENPSLANDIKHFIRSFGYANSENIWVAVLRAKCPPSNNFRKHHTLLLTHPPEELATYLIYQQTFAFKTSKEGGQKKIAFHALPFDKSVQTWIITDISRNYVTTDSNAKMSALATIKAVLSHDCNFRNVVNKCYGETASPLDLNGRVEDALHSFHLMMAALPQQGKEDHTVWQLMEKPISSNHNHQDEWVSIIQNVTYLVNHIFPLKTHRVIK
ncbi:hypothetical protein L208DRAFT_1523895, partial [Tricholoma matsutake]